MSESAQSRPSADKPSASATTSASGNASASTPKPRFNKEQWTNTVKTLQFVWFVGHVVTLIGIFFFALTKIRIGTRFYKFWHATALLGILESFGILIFQLFQKTSSVVTVLKDDNTQYFLLSAFLLLLRPYVLLTLLPFALFSVFHVLAYTNTYLLPVAGLENHPISKTIGDFVSNNNIKSVQLASILEIYTYAYLFLRLLTIRNRSLTPFLIYSVFLKVRYEKSIFTRNYIKSLEVKVDSLVNNVEVPAVKQGWSAFKHAIRRTGSVYLVNDYTKEKST